MRELAMPFLAIAVAMAAWATVVSMRMVAWLSGHGVKVNWLWIRALLPWYVHRYKTMTSESEGKPGPLFAQFLIAINLAAAFVLLAVVLLVAGGG